MIADRTPIRRTWLDGGGPFVPETDEHRDYFRWIAEWLDQDRADADAVALPVPPGAARPRRDRTADVLVVLIWLGAATAAVMALLAVLTIAGVLLRVLGGGV